MALNLYLNTAASDPANAVVRSEVALEPQTMPTLVYCDQVQVNLYLADGTGSFDSRSGAAGYSIRVGIGPTNAAPSSGTFTLTLDGDTTSALSYGASAATVQSALNALASVISAGGVTVTGSAPIYRISFVTAGARSLLTADATSLTPTSEITVGRIQTGDGSKIDVQSVRMVRSPVVYQTTWNQITNGWSGWLDLATYELGLLLGSDASLQTDFEVEITDGSGNRTTLAKPQITIRGEVVDANPTTPVAPEEYPTNSEAVSRFVNNKSAFNLLTGGTPTALDSLETVDLAYGTMVAVIAGASQLYIYRLENLTTATSSPNFVRPVDYAETTNEKVWQLFKALPYAHASTHANGGTDEINVAGLSGELADPQPPKTHAASHTAGNTDPIQLDDLAAPDDNTDLDVSTSAHGLCPKAPNDSSQFLDGTGAWSTPTIAAQEVDGTVTVMGEVYDYIHREQTVMMYGKTTNAVPMVLTGAVNAWGTFPDSNGISYRPGGTVVFDILVSARNTGPGTQESAAWRFTGVMRIQNSVGTLTASIVQATKDPLYTDNASLNCDVYTDGTKSLGVQVTGVSTANKYCIWTARVSYVVAAGDSTHVA
jgi:hypothetical protein